LAGHSTGWMTIPPAGQLLRRLDDDFTGIFAPADRSDDFDPDPPDDDVVDVVNNNLTIQFR